MLGCCWFGSGDQLCYLLLLSRAIKMSFADLYRRSKGLRFSSLKEQLVASYLDFRAIVANSFQNLFCLYKKARMKNRFAQLDMSKMTRTIRHTFTTSLALECTFNSTHSSIKQAAFFRPFADNSAIVEVDLINLGNRHWFLVCVRESDC